MAIDKSYWKNDINISVSEKEKSVMLNYEIWMFREACKKLSEKKYKERFEQNLLVEALAIHSRVLIGFFYERKINKNDIIADDFILNWSSIRPERSQILYDAKNKADKQLAHLSGWRIKIEKDGKKGWNNKIAEDIEKVIKKFQESLPT